MKHILLERYLLSEATNKRFILTEESAEETIINSLNKVIDRINKIINKLSSLKTDTARRTTTLKELEDLIDQAHLTDDPKITQAKIQEYILKVEALFPGKRINLYPNVKKDLDELKALVSVPKLKRGMKTDIITKAKDIQKNLITPSIKKSGKEMQGPASADDQGKAECVELLNEVLQKLTALKERPDLLVANTKEAIANKNAIYKLISSEEEGGLPLVDNVTSAKYEQIKETCRTFLNTPMSTVSARIAASEKRDWAALYASAATDEEKQNILEEYYKAEWGNYADTIKALGAVFTSELFALGWNDVTNPLITFLKQNIFRLNITKETYSVIHNAYVRGQISGADLRQKGDFGKANIIFNPNLYEKAAVEMVPYLEEQAKFRTQRYSLTAEVKKLFNTQEGKIKVLCNLFLQGGNTSNLATEVANIYAPLKSISAIKVGMKFIVEDPEKKQEITPSEAAALISSFNGNAKKAITYLINSYALDYYKEIRNFDTNKYKVITIADTNPLTFGESILLRNQLGLDNFEMTKDIFTAILEVLAKKANAEQVKK